MKHYKPTTPSQRNTTRVNYREELSGDKPHKALTGGFYRAWGRNHHGRITTRHKGGGHKRRLRDIDFMYDKHDVVATIETIEYDPNRSGFIGLALYQDGARRYVILPATVKVGDTFIVSVEAPVKPGNRMMLKNMPLGTFVYNIEMKPNGGSKIARSAGNYAEVVAQDNGKTHLKMPSTEVRQVVGTAWACVGAVSNDEHRLMHLGKAGRSRHLGIRPTVRGTAMNPVDHPHGGGEGKMGRGHRRARSMWGKPTGKGQKSRRPKKYSNVFILNRRKVGKKS